MPYIGNEPTSVAFLTDSFSGNGTTTAFTMSAAPASTSAVLVAVTGVLQDPSTYSVVGTTLTFSAAPPTGTGNISVRYLGIPASGVTTTAYRTITEFTATAGQTTFTPPSYTPGFIKVYRNGALLSTTDYTATTGTTVVLGSSASVGDLIAIESFYVSSVLNAIPATPGSVTSTYIVDGAVTTSKIADLNVTAAKIASSAVTTTKIADTSITPAKLSQPLTFGTAQATTSGTSVDITGIPSWARRITVLLNGVSTNGTSALLLQIGSGSITTSGYSSRAATENGTQLLSSAGFILNGGNQASALNSGSVQLFNISGNVWICSGLVCDPANRNNTNGGVVTLTGALDRVRMTTVIGTDAFDAGSINILYE